MVSRDFLDEAAFSLAGLQPCMHGAGDERHGLAGENAGTPGALSAPPPRQPGRRRLTGAYLGRAPPSLGGRRVNDKLNPAEGLLLFSTEVPPRHPLHHYHCHHPLALNRHHYPPDGRHNRPVHYQNHRLLRGHHSHGGCHLHSSFFPFSSKKIHKSTHDHISSIAGFRCLRFSPDPSPSLSHLTPFGEREREGK